MKEDGFDCSLKVLASFVVETNGVLLERVAAVPISADGVSSTYLIFAGIFTAIKF